MEITPITECAISDYDALMFEGDGCAVTRAHEACFIGERIENMIRLYGIDFLGALAKSAPSGE